MVWIRLNLPKKVHSKLKAAAAMAGTTLTEYLLAILTGASERKDEQ